MINEKETIQTNALISRIKQLANLYESQSEFARAVQMSRQGVSLILNDKVSNLSYTTIAQIARSTACSLDWLILGRGAPFLAAKAGEDKSPEKIGLMKVKSVISDFEEAGTFTEKDLVVAIKGLCDLYLSGAQKR